jgi:hypothetical protein
VGAQGRLAAHEVVEDVRHDPLLHEEQAPEIFTGSEL